MLPPIPSFISTLRLVSPKIITKNSSITRLAACNLHQIIRPSYHNKTATPPTSPATPTTTAIIAPSVAFAPIIITGEPPPPSELVVLITSEEAPVLVAAGTNFSHPPVRVTGTSSVLSSKPGALIVLTKVAWRVEVEPVDVEVVLKMRL